LSFTTVVVTISGHFFSYDKSMPMPGTLAAVFNRHAPLQFFHHHSTTDFADVLIVFRDLGQLDLSSSNQLISVICGP
jgi:hypothetical protein